MISPKNRLIFFTGIIVIPFTLTAVISPVSSAVSVIAIFSFIGVAIVDGILSIRRLAGVSVALPEVIRLSQDREGLIKFSCINSNPSLRQLTVGLPFPKDISSPNEYFVAPLPENAASSTFQWPCTASKRGRYAIKSCHLETASLLGFWAIRSNIKTDSEIRVYPNLLSEKKNLAALFLNRGDFGMHHQRQVGQGREFEKLREYIHGDSFDSIHWKATAKRGRPITKVFQIERTQEVYIIIDSSRLSTRHVLMNNNKQPVEVLDRFITSSLLLGIAAEHQGDQFGLLNFSNRVNDFVRAKNGRAHFNHCRDTLYTLEASTVSPDFDELFSFISRTLTKRALLVFLTSLDDPVLSESFMKNIDMICRKHLVLVNMIKPDNVESMFARSDVTSINDIYKNLGGHILLNNLEEIRKVLKIRGIRFNLLDKDIMCPQLVTQYMDIKQRQLL